MPLTMHLKSRLIITYLFFILVAVGIAFCLYQYFILPSYSSLENQEAQHYSERLHLCLDKEIDSLDHFTKDYAHWDDSKQFLKDSDPAYITSNFTDQMFDDNQLSLVAIYDLNGQLIYAKNFNLVSSLERPLHDSMCNEVWEIFRKGTKRSLKGLFLNDDGLQMVAVRSITGSDGLGSPLGTMLFMRPLGNEFINGLSRQSRLDIRLLSTYNDGYAQALKHINTEHPVYIETVSKDKLVTSLCLFDIKNQPTAIIQLHLPRNLYVNARTTMIYASSFSLIAIMLAALFMGATIRYMVQMPFKQLATRINQLRNGSGTMEPIDSINNFDTAGLSNEFNLLIIDIKKSKSNQNFTKENADLIKRVVPSAIFTVDLDKVITSWNDRARLLTGYTAAEMIGCTCFLFAQEPCKEYCGLFDNLECHKPIMGRECTIKHKNGSILTISKNADYLRDENGKIIGGIECFEDITTKKNAEIALQKEVALNSRLALLSQVILQSNGNTKQVATKLLDYARSLTNSSDGFVAERFNNNQQVLWSTTALFDNLEVQAGFKTIFALAAGRGSLLHAVYNSQSGIYFNSLGKLQGANLAAGVNKTITHFMAVPVIYGEQVIGQVALANNEKGYSKKDLQVIAHLADLFALALYHNQRQQNEQTNSATYMPTANTL